MIVVIAAVAGNGNKDNENKQASTTESQNPSGDSSDDLDSASDQSDDSSSDLSSDQSDDSSENPSGGKEEKNIKYISVSADQLSEDLEKNAMKAADSYNGKYLKITGKLGNIDSSGDYINIKSNKDFDMTSIQCYIKSDEQKKVIMKKEKGNKITVKGKCIDVGEVLGYSIDIDEIK